MMDYTVWNPGGNVTVFGNLPRGGNPAELGRALLDAEPRAEQAGFLRYDLPSCDVRLDMAGGEFCGNASLSAAAEFAMLQGLPAGGRRTVRLSCSGVDRNLDVELERIGESLFLGSLEMPAALDIRDFHGYPAVILPGIAHVIAECPEGSISPETLLRDWCSELDAEALGILFLDRERGTMVPYVYVKAVDSICRESACASGSCAVACHLAKESGGRVTAELLQPGGSITVTAVPDGPVLLTGRTEFLRHGTT